jgi:hypothetical protein
MNKGLPSKLVNCLRCKRADHEEACCAFTGFATPAADAPHGCPLEIRIRALHNLPRHAQADARTLVMRSLQRGQSELLLEDLGAANHEDRGAFQALVLNTELAAMHVEGDRGMLDDFEGSRRWLDGRSGPGSSRT